MDAQEMAAIDDPRLEPDMLLKCSRCGQWHAVHFDRANAGDTDYANEMLYWWCGGGRYYAGQIGGRTSRPVKRPAR
jgi:hypothetical protein